MGAYSLLKSEKTPAVVGEMSPEGSDKDREASEHVAFGELGIKRERRSVRKSL